MCLNKIKPIRNPLSHASMAKQNREYPTKKRCWWLMSATKAALHYELLTLSRAFAQQLHLLHLLMHATTESSHLVQQQYPTKANVALSATIHPACETIVKNQCKILKMQKLPTKLNEIKCAKFNHSHLERQKFSEIK